MSTDRYEDIIGLPHHQSKKHPHMPLHDRAAQFMPFAALTGYEDEITEAGRLTDSKAELDESVQQIISDTLARVRRKIREQPEVQGFCFIPDERKEGGAVSSFSGRAAKVDPDRQILVLQDGTELPFSDLIALELL